MILTFFVAASLASEIPLKPEAPLLSVNQCANNIPLSLGKKAPAELMSEDGILKCSAIAVPTSEYADLLAIEVWADQVAAHYIQRTKLMELELKWYESQELKWWQKPNAQRALGFIEATAILGASAWLYNKLEN